MLTQKKKAIFLVILVMLDIRNANSSPVFAGTQPNNGPKTDQRGVDTVHLTEHASGATVHPEVDNNTTNHPIGGATFEDSGKAGLILQPSKDSATKQPGSRVGTTGLLKWLTDTLVVSGILDTIPEIDCGVIGDDFFENSMQTIPIARELSGFLILVLHIGNGCHEKSLTILREMRKDFDDEDSLSEVVSSFIEGLKEGLETSSDGEDGLVDKDRNRNYTRTDNIRKKRSAESGADFGLIPNSSIVQEVAPKNETSISIALEDISTRVRVLESLMYESPAKPKLCRWSMFSTTKCHKVSSSRKHTSLSEAQVRCEAIGRDCIGVEEHVKHRTYVVVNRCRDKRTVVRGDKKLLWVKDCKNILGGSIHHNNTRHKRDIQPAVNAKLYQHVNFKGDFKTVAGALDYVGDEFNKKISSLSCDSLCTVIVFQHRGFTGWQLAFENRTNYVGGQFNDAVSSVVVLPYSLSDLCYVLYEHEYYNGQKRHECGDSKLSTPMEIASIKLLCTGCSVIIYTEDFRGSFTSFTSSKGYVAATWRRQKIRSVQVRPWQIEGYEGHIYIPVHFYQHKSFTGSKYAHEGKVSYVGSQQNDMFSSFKCSGQCNVLAFEHSDFKGEAFLYQGSEGNLEDTEFNDKISSLLMLPFSICVTVYEHSYFEGRSRRYCEDSLYLGSSWGDRISSMAIECDHCSVIVYEHSSFKGKYKAFTGMVSYVGKGWNDIVSSIQIRPWLLDDYEGCTADAGEAKAYDVIQWIPIFSWLYSLCSSIYYAAKGCSDVAKSRAIDMALDLGMDIIMAVVTVATAGTGTAAVFGIKTAIQTGVKAGAKAFGKALAAGAKVGLKNSLKAIKAPLKLGIKGLVKKAGGKISALGKSVKIISKTALSTMKGGVKKIAHVATEAGQINIKASAKNIGSTAAKGIRKVGSKVKKGFKSKIDDVYDAAARNIDEVRGGNAAKVNPKVKSADGKIRCRRMETGCQQSLTPLQEMEKWSNNIELAKRDFWEDVVARRKKAMKTTNVNNVKIDLENTFIKAKLKDSRIAPDLTIEEFYALKRWTTRRHITIGKALNGVGSGKDELVFKECAVLQRALQKSDKYVLGRDEKLIRFDFYEIKNDAWETKYKIKNTVLWKSFKSTSADPHFLPKRVPGSQGTNTAIKFEIKSNSGVDMTPYFALPSYAKAQKEVLLPVGLELRVTKVGKLKTIIIDDKEWEIVVIKMKEVVN